MEGKDSPGFYSNRYGYPTKWTHELNKQIAYAVLVPYITNKFVLYDSVKIIEGGVEFSVLASNLGELKNLALVNDSQDEHAIEQLSVLASKSVSKDKARIIKSIDRDFEVKDHTISSVSISIETDSDKFLVYNDSFHPDWKVYVNGNKMPVYRANHAFKGVVVPRGKSSVIFKFEPFGKGWPYMIILALFSLLLIYALYERIKDGRQVETI